MRALKSSCCSDSASMPSLRRARDGVRDRNGVHLIRRSVCLLAHVGKLLQQRLLPVIVPDLRTGTTYMRQLSVPQRLCMVRQQPLDVLADHQRKQTNCTCSAPFLWAASAVTAACALLGPAVAPGCPALPPALCPAPDAVPVPALCHSD